jgi:broad specificity phosphatase PhoE
MRGIYLIRHGNTTYDTKVDALLNPPLNRDGVERIERTVKFLDREQLRFKRILSSPLQRALRVAEMISRGNTKVTTNNAILPWNLGDLMGKEGKAVATKLDYLKNYPDIKAPHGESYRTFYLRWTGFLQTLMDFVEAHPDEAICITTHSRNINALQSLIDGNPIGDVLESTPEASVTLLAQTGLDWKYNVIWDGR